MPPSASPPQPRSRAGLHPPAPPAPIPTPSRLDRPMHPDLCSSHAITSHSHHPPHLSSRTASRKPSSLARTLPGLLFLDLHSCTSLLASLHSVSISTSQLLPAHPSKHCQQCSIAQRTSFLVPHKPQAGACCCTPKQAPSAPFQLLATGLQVQPLFSP